MKQKLVVICGPTASGKTALAVAVARRLGGEIVSADSMQVYRGMDVGTAKPTEGERGGVPHHLMDCADPGEEFGAARYQAMAQAAIADITGRVRLPILCGGTGLYIGAAVYPLTFDGVQPDEAFREQMRQYAAAHGNEALHGLLIQADPEAAAAVHPNNVRRVIRALERARGESAAPGNQLFNGEPLYDLAWVGLTMDRAALYRRIDERVDKMMERGLLDEVRRLAGALGNASTALQALGYKELIRHINGEISLAEATEQIKTGTRNYAKRQLTWFKRESAIRWFDVLEYDGEHLAGDVCGYIKATLRI